jgi:tetratricopeptide (TPR) repeat protein
VASHPPILAGEVVAFVGRFFSMSRAQAAEAVARSGGTTDPTPGERTTMMVVGADSPAPGDAPVRARVVSEDEFCRLVGRVPPADLRQQYYGWRTLQARYPAVRDDYVRYLEKWGLLRSAVRTPGDVYLGFADLSVLKQANAELLAGTPFRAVVRALAASRAGQLLLDFKEAPAGPASANVVSLARPSRVPAEARLVAPRDDRPLTAAEQRFLDGERLDSGDRIDVEGAMQAYRDAVALDPTLAPAMVNLGNLHYALDHLVEAQGLYLQAAVADPACFEAHFNLGNVHHDLGRFEDAAACYRQALRLNAGYADAHFYLAVTLEKLGRSPDAQPHWRQYRELAPDGEWVDLAIEFSE